MRRLAVLALAALAGACAAPPPPPGAELRAEILFVHRAEDLGRMAAASPEPERIHIESSGFAPAVREGRAVRLRCALADDEVLIADAIAPPGLRLTPGELVRVAWGSTDPVVPNRILGPYQGERAIPAVRERRYLGTRQLLPWSATPVFAPLEPWEEADYAPVRSYLLLRCRPPR